MMTNDYLDLTKLRMPRLSPQPTRQWTGKGWIPVDFEQAERHLRDVREAIAQRLTEITDGERSG